MDIATKSFLYQIIISRQTHHHPVDFPSGFYFCDLMYRICDEILL